MERTPSPPDSSDPLRRLSDDLHALSAGFTDHAVTLGEVMEKLGARASAMLILTCALPFCTPITIPGLSVPFGFVILTLALRLAGGRPPWLPSRLRAMALPPKFFSRVLEAGSKVVAWIERQLRPRWAWFSDEPWKLRAHALVVAAAALLLLLPIPPVLPFTNTLPALVIVVLTMSLLERDGFGLVAGHTLFALTACYLALWATVIWEAVERLLARFAV